MLVRAEALIRKLRRLGSPEEWTARLLKPSEEKAGPGLLMIQIDGLSHTQFEQALGSGRMPFLRRLIAREAYRCRRLYSGIPSNTPAVQGQLFYGVRSCVPAFSFQNSATRRVVHMFQPGFAGGIEKVLLEKGERPLLRGGSAYGDMFTGGAAEAHFCAAAIGWGAVLGTLRNTLYLPFLILFNLHVAVVVCFRVVLELFGGLFGALRGIAKGRGIAGEFAFVPLRVTILGVLQEIIAAGARIDAARGLPAVHMNFAGYDEMAHHHGPGSRTALQSLRGIDRAIAGVWRAARKSHRRDYEVFIYSDHGQEATQPYAEVHGESVKSAVAEMFAPGTVLVNGEPSVYPGPARWHARTLRPLRDGSPAVQLEAVRPPDQVVITTMGPIAHVYPPEPLELESAGRIAAGLVASAGVPLVITPDGPGRALAWNAEGQFQLPEDAGHVLDPDHPFLHEVADDLVALAHHPDAGALVLMGWRPGASLTFAREAGAHAGPGPEETTGFSLLPADALPAAFGGSMTIADLRTAALSALEERDGFNAAQPAAQPSRRLRVMTYNVHACLGRDGRSSPDRIARIITRYEPDVVCIQELDVVAESHQAEIIAGRLGLQLHYHPVFQMKKGRHGNAILSRFPMRVVASGSLPRRSTSRLHEPRGALWVEVEVGPFKVQLLNTHLSLSPPERLAQARALLGPAWLGHPDCRDPVILCGDFNASPASRAGRLLGAHLRNAQFDLAGHRVRRTLPGLGLWGPVDHVFLGKGIVVRAVEVPETYLERTASDHLPLVVDLEVA